MRRTRPDGQRTRFRRPLGVTVMAYKAVLGLSEIIVGVLLAVPSFDPQATFARLSAEELREDPGDPTAGHIFLAVGNVTALAVLVLLLRGWLPGRPLQARINRR